MNEAETKILNQVREYFMRPGAVLAQEDGGTTCVYRGEHEPHSPVRCAFGVLIPDELYSPAMEENIASAVLRDYSELAALFEGIDESFLDTIQFVHDSASSVEEFLSQLAVVERDYS